MGKNVDSKPSWQQYCLFIRVTRSKKEELFFTQSAVITKVEIIPFSMGILFFISFEPFVNEKEKNDGPSSNREATIFFFFFVGQNHIDGKNFMRRLYEFFAINKKNM